MLYETYKLGKLKKSPVQRFYTREELESYELPRLKEICRAESIKPPSVETFYNKQKMVALLYKYLGIVKKDMITLYSEKGCIFLKDALKSQQIPACQCTWKYTKGRIPLGMKNRHIL